MISSYKAICGASLVLQVLLNFSYGIPEKSTVSSPEYGPTGCGQFETKHKTSDLRTLGKSVTSFPEEADIITSPYLALVGFENPEVGLRIVCAGSLISDEWVLTAAHCGNNANITLVRLGDYDIENSVDLPLEHPLEFDVTELHYHPDYIKGENHDDMVLIKLSSKVPLYRYDIRPICLPWGDQVLKPLKDIRPVQEGWPVYHEESKIGSTPTSSAMTIVDPTSCSFSLELPETFFDFTKHSDGMVCAKIADGQTADSATQACHHISGSALVYSDEFDKKTLIGFITIGQDKRCRLENYPNIYMSTFHRQTLLWIKEVVFGDVSA